MTDDRDGGPPAKTARPITVEALKGKLDRGDDFKLVMALGDWYFASAHIPGSISVSSNQEIGEKLVPEDEIVVYCTNRDCPASRLLYHELDRRGFRKLHRFEDGIDGWRQAGLPLEGERVR